MLRFAMEHRPKQLLAVYVEQQRVEILRAHRQWRSWQIDSVEQLEVPQLEPIYDYLQRLNIRPRDKKATTLVLFLPLSFYSFHREHYPAGLQDQLQEALNFDWQENIFLEYERTLHFSGPAVPVNHSLSVPIFSMQRDIFDKFHQVLGAANFQSFRIVPTSLVYRAFIAPAQPPTPAPELDICARLIDSSHMELHRFYRGQFLDSMLIGKDEKNFRAFVEHLRFAENSMGETATIPVRLICTENETAGDTACKSFHSDDIVFETECLQGSLVSHWVSYLLEQDQILTFGPQLLLKPWKIPRIAWPLLAMAALYSVFAVYQIHTHGQLQDTSRRLKREIAQLDTQWKPIEQLQTRIAKFQDDQKTLSQFNLEGYPLLEILTLLTQTTPEDTWLNYFSVRKGQIILRGDSKSAIKFLSELSKVEGFSDVRFASPVTRSPQSDDERFNVQLQVDSEKLRKTIEALGINKGEETVEPSTPDQNGTVSDISKPGKRVRPKVVGGEEYEIDEELPDDEAETSE
jgi:Tfp pilus assembly protein PilN